MTSEKHALANRQNARKSTGPITVSGKAVSAQNALKHGVLAQVEVLLSRGEKAADLVTLREELYQDLRPEGSVESLLVDRIVSLVWRLRRLQSAEVGLFNEAAEHFESLPNDLELALGRPPKTNEGASAQGHAFFYRYTEGGLSTLSRYEASIERGLFKALHELQRLQVVRAGGNVPLPVAVDVDLGE